MTSNNTLGPFEEQWAEAFNQAEANPSEQLWMNIDGALANAEANKYRRGVIFYRLLAAASLFIAFGLALLLIFQSDSIPAEEIITSNDSNRTKDSGFGNKLQVSETDIQISTNDENELQNLAEEKNTLEHPPNKPSIQSIDLISQAVVFTPETKKDTSETAAPVLIDQFDNRIASNATSMRVGSVNALKARNPNTNSFLPNTDIYMYNVPMAVINKSKFRDNQLWAGLGLSSGSFNPNIGNGSESIQAADAALESDNFNSLANRLEDRNEIYDPGFSYSIAANAGWKFAPRWVLQGGLQYQLSKSGTQTNQLIQNRITQENFAPSDLRSLDISENAADFEVINSDVNLNNNFQFLSVPLKIGYLIFDRKVQLGLNAGFSTDFFLKNKVNESNNLIESFEQARNDESPYKKTSFSGLLGIEVGYNFLNNYYFTLEPSYRRSLNSFTKESSNLNSKPTRLGLTVGFKYLFK